MQLADRQAREVLRCTLLYSPLELDLHGFTQMQAEVCTHLFLDHHANTNEADYLKIITGRGNNSRGGVAVLLPVIKSLLSNHYCFSGHLDATGGSFTVCRKR